MGGICQKEEPKTNTISFARQANKPEKTNKVSTTRYSIISFVPKSIIIQFVRPANYVYLIMSIAQSIPEISSLHPITALAPIIFVIIVALIKQGIEDYVIVLGFQKRYKNDLETNERQTRRLIKQNFEICKWEDIVVGDFVKIYQNQLIPADVILLSSSQQNSICYVQTANLDGESNLKTKSAFVQDLKLYPTQFEKLIGEIVAERPNSNLHQFIGKINLNHHESQLSMENLLVRGSMLKNTDEVVGIVIYAGHDTKIMKNTGELSNKISQVQKKVNRIQLFLFFCLILLSLITSIRYYQYHTQYSQGTRKDFFYLSKSNIDRNSIFEALLSFFISFLLLSFIIPISMNVALEGIKIFLGLFVSYDNKMYYSPLHCYCSTLNMSIIQELGCVDYVLTDKTGTLTANEMKFRYAWVNGYTFQAESLLRRFGQLESNVFGLDSLVSQNQNSQKSLIKTNMIKIKTREEQSLDETNLNEGIKSEQLQQFMKAVILCHDVVADIKKKQFQGSSPDQVCFVEFAYNIGFKFVKRTKNSIEINVRGQKIVYQLMYMLPFTPRKRMSVIVKNLVNNQIILYTKGADSTILEKSKKYLKQSEMNQTLTNFSVEGLRTLVFSKRNISSQQFSQFIKQIQKNQKSKLEGLTDLFVLQQQYNTIVENIQSNLDIIGCTAIEDRLQDQVPQTIARLQKAGIIVMMVTGDKLETAQNIGRLSNFIHSDAVVYQIKSNIKEIHTKVISILQQIDKKQINSFSVVIEGQSIQKLLNLQQQESIELLMRCKSVIFCRSSPKQKALIVKFVKEKLKGVVLAIGDGGNDVGMIQQANIGVGLVGKEGNQASSSSDFYFGQFKFLDRLLLHHGRWIYYRMAYFFVYYGFKNLTMTLIMFYFLANSAYSGFAGMSQPFLTVYNSVAGLLLVSYYSVLDQDINADLYPQCYHLQPTFYKQFKQLDLFSYKRYIVWSILGVIMSLLLHYSFVETLGGINIVDQDGHLSDYTTYASGISISLSASVIIIIISDMNNINWISGIIFTGIITIVGIALFYVVQNYFQLTNVNVSSTLTNNQNFRFWATILLMVGLTIMTKYGWNAFTFLQYPTQTQKALQKRNQKTQFPNEISEPQFN